MLFQGNRQRLNIRTLGRMAFYGRCTSSNWQQCKTIVLCNTAQKPIFTVDLLQKEWSINPYYLVIKINPSSFLASNQIWIKLAKKLIYHICTKHKVVNCRVCLILVNLLNCLSNFSTLEKCHIQINDSNIILHTLYI